MPASLNYSKASIFQHVLVSSFPVHGCTIANVATGCGMFFNDPLQHASVFLITRV